MKSLSKKDLKEKDEFIKLLGDKTETINDRVQEVNEAIQRLNEAIDDYNGTIQDVNRWAQDLVSQMETYRDARSEKWIDSDVGQQYDSWIQSWADDLNEMDEVEEVSAPSTDAITTLEDRTTAPDEM